MRKLNQTAKNRPKTPKLPGSGGMTSTPIYALGPDNSTRVSRSDLKKKKLRLKEEIGRLNRV